jgi:hypothetical protein
MVSKLKCLYICNAFMCCISDILGNAYVGILKEMRYMEIVQRKDKFVACLFISLLCNLSLKIT